MLKSSIINVRVYNTFVKTFFRSYWYTLFLVPPVILYLVLTYFNEEISRMLMVLFPPSAGTGTVYYTDFVELVAAEVLWIFFFFFLVTALTLHVPRGILERFARLGVAVPSRLFLTMVCILFFGVAIMTALVILEGFPNSPVEYSYLLQADIFSRDKLWERSHILPDFFSINEVVQHDGIIVSRYTPGWPLILTVAYGFDVSPAVVNPALALIVLIVVYYFARRLFDANVAFWTLLAVCLTAYFVFQASSYLSHMWALLLTVVFVGAIHLYQERECGIFVLLAGFSIGLLGLSRPYTALLVMLPFVICLVWQYRGRAVLIFTMMLIGALPCVAYFLWYNYSITGDAFNPVSLWAYQSGNSGDGDDGGLKTGFEHIVQWAFMFCYWVSPGFFVFYVIFMWRKLRDAATRFLHAEDYICLILAAGYFFYSENGGDQYGPRYLFEGFPFLILFVVRQVMQSGEKWMYAFLFTSILLAAVKLPFISEREALVVDQRQDMFDLVRAQEITNAVVLVASGTSPIRPMEPEDLTRNDVKFQNDVIYARDLTDIRQELMEFYDDRSFYRYTRRENEVHGELVKLR